MTCSWPIDRSCLDAAHPLPELGEDPTDAEQAAYDTALAQRNNAEDLAVHVLWALSGRQFGVCPVTVRPCGQEPCWPARRESYVLAWLDGGWSNQPCGCGPGACAVAGPRVAHLPGPANPHTDDTPITVTIDGDVLPADQYVLEGDVLYRVDDSWPSQDLGRPLGEPGTWSVTYHRGVAPPAGVSALVGQLAKEFIAGCGDTGKCRIPANLTGTSRQGVSKTFDPAKILASRRTGLREIDQWLAAVNPHSLTQPPEVL
ncbi:Uncharacterised protein [Mycolicibacterium vanbaalenii]|uniref:Head-to-tail adaptor n=1 Tax=Mycolicibacterium vanbaalenii TaxID=110539 RepID=A0A5S9R7E6_MYCVN|nr:hypothetical protein [Mycolicibacterium vanbaalenii]CAA0134545.1 Uncharacterised protein [Mycolicibacterium vanbaalenii]